jgi:4-amino-4-deoxychorismate lyase
MSQFIETIKIENGKIKLLDYHNERFNKTRQMYFCVDDYWDLKPLIQIPFEYQKGIVKCRIIYDIEIRKIQFSHYQAQAIRRLKLIESEILYDYKFIDRRGLENLKNQALPADDVLIVKANKLTDTSFANVLFLKNGQWFTSDSPLLEGVQRAYLLNQGWIEEGALSVDDLNDYEAFMLINALNDFDESRALPIQNILK